MPGDGLELEWEDDSDQSCSGLFAGEQVPMAPQDRHTLMKGELGLEAKGGPGVPSCGALGLALGGPGTPDLREAFRGLDPGPALDPSAT